MISNYSPIYGHILGRIARRIDVLPRRDAERPYRAVIRLAHPAAVAPGHPYMLAADAYWPEEAVDEVIAMLIIWFDDPTSEELVVARSPTGSRRAPGLLRQQPPTTPGVQ
jgi:hypothetical protein